MSAEIGSKTSAIALFEPGMLGSAAYRIPSLWTTSKGTVIAGIDIRWKGARDNPNHISIGIRRSEDGGTTWDPIQVLVRYPGEGEDGAAAIDSSLLEDADTGTLWMLFSHTPGGIGLWQSEQGIGFDTSGRRLLYDDSGREYALAADGTVYDEVGATTEYRVNGDGEVRKDGFCAGNMYLKRTSEPRSLLEARTTFLQLIRSDDDGRTWSKPIELNPQVKKGWMKFLGGGPGRGLQLKRGAHRGRLLFPVYFSNLNGRLSNALIYSDDRGETWRMGQSPNDGRVWEGRTISAENLDTASGQLTESQAVELPNGDVKCFIRNHSGTKRTAVCTSKDGGVSWGEVTFVSELVDPICQSSVIEYPGETNAEGVLIWSNPADPDRRAGGTVRLSEDGGRTWPYARTVHKGAFWYSCLTVLPDRSIGLLYEGDETRIYFTRFGPDWIKERTP